MKFKINHQSGDWLFVEGETVEECREKAYAEGDKRCWKKEDCWSEKIEE